jgi:hypothetical protein
MLLHRRGFFLGVFLTQSGEDDGTGEAVAVRMREWASVEREKEGLYKDEGGVWCTTTRVHYAWLQRAPRHEANPSTFGVLSSTLGPYSEILYVLSFSLEYLNWQVQYTQFYPQVADQQRVNK